MSGTLSSQKNEILFSECGTNYNNELPIYRKGSVLIRKLVQVPPSKTKKHVVYIFHEDIIGDNFWKENTEILSLDKLRLFQNIVANDIFFYMR